MDDFLDVATSFCSTAARFALSFPRLIERLPEVEFCRVENNDDAFEHLDVIAFPTVGSVHHYGIVVLKDGIKFYLHFMPERKEDGKLDVSTDILNGRLFQLGKVYRIRLRDIKSSRMGNRLKKFAEGKFGEYNALTNNCQHFVNYVLRGEHSSFSVDVVTNVVTDIFSKFK
eukprot:GILK01001165.1.p2 GENE.GILK01001165.1~~GILK01001165.1.p2  ORF type:complete len:186 (-),score=27.61 GILK01001165.1:182-694(-)